MKKTFFLKVVFLMAFLSLSKFASLQKQIQPFKLQVGNKLIYKVEQGDQAYKFIITIKTLTPTLSFDWKMTEPINKKGTINMSKKAMDSAIAMFNNFTEGITKLENQTSAFLSRSLYKQLQDGSPKIKFSVTNDKNDAEDFDVLTTNKSSVTGNIYFTMDKKYKGKNYTLDSYTLENKDGSHILRVWKNESFPLILFMETDFKIYLSEIQ